MTGKVGTRFQRASGTSQSTAVVSGLAALILSKYPTATPDAIKRYLQTVTTGIDQKDRHGGNDDHYSGAGSANVGLVATSNQKDVLAWLRTIPQVPPTGTGTGTIEAARGGYHVTVAGVALTGEVDIFGNPLDAGVLAAATVQRASWVGGVWNGAQWTGDAWDGARWSATTWTASDWTGARWSGARWTDAIWDGARWSGARWSGARWSAGNWDGARWSGARWSDNLWA